MISMAVAILIWLALFISLSFKSLFFFSKGMFEEPDINNLIQIPVTILFYSNCQKGGDQVFPNFSLELLHWPTWLFTTRPLRRLSHGPVGSSAESFSLTLAGSVEIRFEFMKIASPGSRS